MSQRRFGVGRRSPIRRLNGYEALLSAQIADGALGAWTMQETSGTTMLDLSGNGRNGTYSVVTLNQAPVIDTAARSVLLPSGNHSISVAYGTWLNADYWTVEVAARPNELGYNSLLNRSTGSAPNEQFIFRLTTGALAIFGYNDAGIVYSATTPTAVTANNETHLYAMCWADGEMSGWVDGVKVLSVATTGVAQKANAGLRIGLESLPILGTRFRGYMSHAAYYGTALSDAQMLYHAQAAGLA